MKILRHFAAFRSNPCVSHAIGYTPKGEGIFMRWPMLNDKSRTIIALAEKWRQRWMPETSAGVYSWVQKKNSRISWQWKWTKSRPRGKAAQPAYVKILLCRLRCAEIRIITKSLARVRVISWNLLSLRSRYVQIVSGRKSPAKAQISTRRPNVSAHAILRNAGGQCTFLKIERHLAALPEYFYKRKLNRVSCRRTDTAFCRREETGGGQNFELRHRWRFICSYFSDVVVWQLWERSRLIAFCDRSWWFLFGCHRILTCSCVNR